MMLHSKIVWTILFSLMVVLDADPLGAQSVPHYRIADPKYSIETNMLDTLVGVSTTRHPLCIYESALQVHVIYQQALYSQLASEAEIENLIIKYQMPESETDFWRKHASYSSIHKDYPKLIEQTLKSPSLWERQMDCEKEQVYAQRGRKRPINQMFSEWLGIRRNVQYSVKDNGGKSESISLGTLNMIPYDAPPMSGYGAEHYVQPTADLVKSVLFFIDGQYYTIYGDTQLAEHLPLPEHPEQLAAFRYPGNILYAFSRELPPALQSCGVGPKDNIWIVDQDNHLAVFQTDTKEFIQQIVDFNTSRTLVARDNLSASIFTQADPEAAFQEIGVSVTDTLTTSALDNPRTLPSGTQHVLFSSADQLTYVADRMLKLDHLDPKQNRSAEIEMAEDEYVMEGVYVPETRKAAFLIAKRVKEHPYMIEEVRKSWQHMRIVYLQLME